MNLLIQPVTDKALLPKGVTQFTPEDIKSRYDYAETLIMVKNFSLPKNIIKDNRSSGSCSINARMMMLCCLYAIDNNKFNNLIGEDKTISNADLRLRTYNNDWNILSTVREYINECVTTKNAQNLQDLYVKFASLYFLNPNSILPDADEPVGKQFYRTIYIEEQVIPKHLLVEVIRLTLSKLKCNYFIIASCESVYMKDGSIAGRKCFHESFLLRRYCGKNRQSEWILFDDCSAYANGELIFKI